MSRSFGSSLGWLGWAGAAAVIGVAGFSLLQGRALADAAPVRAPAPLYDPAVSAPVETATLSGGCFWGMQGVYEHVKGVKRVVAGYTGGGAATAQYEIVSTGATGHAESVQITFDPRVISYGRILQIYVSVAADPTELNYQGPDSGTQYRSEIWVADPVQRKVAEAYLAQLGAAHVFAAPIVVRVDQAQPFYQAEGYHQDFLVRHPDYPYIAANDVPKVDNLRQFFPSLYQDTAVTLLPVS